MTGHAAGSPGSNQGLLCSHCRGWPGTPLLWGGAGPWLHHSLAPLSSSRCPATPGCPEPRGTCAAPLRASSSPGWPHGAAWLQAGSSGRVNACLGTINPACPILLLCQGPPHPPLCCFLPSWGCSVPIRPCRSTLPDAQRRPFCHREHRGSGLSPWKTGPQRPWPRRRNVWLCSNPMSMALVLGIQRAVRKWSLWGHERQSGLGCTLGSLLLGQPSLAPWVLPAPLSDSDTSLP